MRKLVLVSVSWIALATSGGMQAVAQNWLPGMFNMIGSAIDAAARPSYGYGGGYYYPGYNNNNYWGNQGYGYGYNQGYGPGYNYSNPSGYYANQQPAANVNPQPAANPNPNPASAPVKIVNPSSSTNTLNYILNGKPYTIQPGYSQSLAAGETWKIQFNRGGTFGNGGYTLSGGTYTFTPTEKGWELYRKAP